RAEEKPWRELLGEWVPRFAPGVVAAAFHGAIRTAHAARSLAAAETPARLRELADGLAYWAANYHELPASTGAAPAGRLPSQAITRVAHLPAESAVNAGFILDRLAPVERFAPFANVAEAVDATGDASAFLSDLTETFAGVFLASVPPGGLITFVHAVTGPSAVRLLLPHLSAPARASILRFAWQGAAAFYCGFGGVPPAPGSTSPPLDRELVDRAIATRDEHAIKFTEACLREHAIRPSPVFLRAAHHAVEQFG
ncbi:MAG TPA: hypothetical protein VKF32_07885, partial [Thermoanaerobaculia bacterium]|nr:hypothetical protein [Thermoanaerobaculia bacterium]